ncbi:MAG: laccase domain-containing protein [Tenuifilaceae bacterium]
MSTQIRIRKNLSTFFRTSQLVSETFGTTELLIVHKDNDDSPIFDLWETNKRILLEAGVLPKNIEISRLCTKCQNSFFFSARAGDNGRFGAGIMLKGK